MLRYKINVIEALKCKGYNSIRILKEMLPEQEQNLAMELVRRLVLAWDLDYTKLTTVERARLEEAENGEYINAKDIVWDD